MSKIYMVTFEDEEGMFQNDPEVVDTLREAEEFIKNNKNKYSPKIYLTIYRCEYCDSFNGTKKEENNVS